MNTQTIPGTQVELGFAKFIVSDDESCVMQKQNNAWTVVHNAILRRQVIAKCARVRAAAMLVSATPEERELFYAGQRAARGEG